MVPKRGEGVRVKDSPQIVRDELTEVQLDGLGSVSWYVTTVKLDLEVKGELERVAKSSPQRLLRRCVAKLGLTGHRPAGTVAIRSVLERVA